MGHKNLTAKQATFAEVYVKTGNASQAFREAYKKDNYKPETIHRRAHDLLNNSKVKARIEELQGALRDKQVYTIDQHIQRLSQLSEEAREAGQYSASIKAEETIGKALGFYMQKLDVTNSDGSMGNKLIVEYKSIPKESDSKKDGSAS